MHKTSIKVATTEEEMYNIRHELSKWSTEDLILDLNLRQSFLTQEVTEENRVGWLTLSLESEELKRRGDMFALKRKL